MKNTESQSRKYDNKNNDTLKVEHSYRVHCSILSFLFGALGILEIATCSIQSKKQPSFKLCSNFYIHNCEYFHFIMMKSYLISEMKCY